MGHGRLKPVPLVSGQTEAVQRLYGGQRCHRLPSARLGEVLTTIGGYGIRHFACHDVTKGDILESFLALVNRPLPLQRLLTSDWGRRRLAILSSCETGVTDGALPDETIGFPARLMYTGVAGVIAFAWPVEPAPATYLLLRTRGNRLNGQAPRDALNEAQLWLRSAMHRELLTYEATHLKGPPPALEDAYRAWELIRPYQKPWNWAAFVYTGA
ncbi:CHAT domain-containing protein [Actinomadura graeca]|uniref:CHAT domain-containing protein n=1 Tax=Actinomadura graeca TaxID=2750812 RepID=A0ABX8R3Y0_9ACTN|nr:CHAT domain-containing protein [Actinomadura graeca]QXJ25757.1 CHAT domain-containing protein [Actinomadura graeca]